jgi:hypothetical protein
MKTDSLHGKEGMMDWTKEQLESIYALIWNELDGCGLVVTDTDLLRKEMGLQPSEEAASGRKTNEL